MFIALEEILRILGVKLSHIYRIENDRLFVSLKQTGTTFFPLTTNCWALDKANKLDYEELYMQLIYKEDSPIIESILFFFDEIYTFNVETMSLLKSEKLIYKYQPYRQEHFFVSRD